MEKISLGWLSSSPISSVHCSLGWQVYSEILYDLDEQVATPALCLSGGGAGAWATEENSLAGRRTMAGAGD